jgi:basic amino acid/polyamine antiporter, APA family
MAVAVIVSGIGAAEWLDADLRRDAARGSQGWPVSGAVRTALSPGVPVFGIVGSTALASVVIVVKYLGVSGSTVFTTLVLMTGITASIPYAGGPPAARHPRFVRDSVVAVVALVFSVMFIG